MVTGTQDMFDREGKKRDLPGPRTVVATTGKQGNGGREAERRLSWPSSEKVANRFKRIIPQYTCPEDC